MSVWYVATSGNDANPGTSAQPFRTIQKSANVANPGDTINVAAGQYNENPVISRSGSSGNPISFVGTGNPIIFTSGDVMKVTGSWITVSGFTFHSANNSSGSGAYVPGGTFCYSLWTSGSNIIFDSCLWENMASPSAHWADSDSADYDAIRLDGTNNVIQNSVIRNLQDMDAFGCAFGTTSTNCMVKNCECYNITNPNYASGPHSDWFQDGGSAIGFVIDGCYIHDCTAQLGVYSSAITTRNCVFANINNGAFIGATGVRWYNNTFYNTGYNYGAPTLFAGYDVQFVNNAVYYSSGGSFQSGTSTGAIDHNYNGASPGFVNGAGNDFHLTSTSPLRGTGRALSPTFPDKDGVARAGTWDVGAYQFVVVTPPPPGPPVTWYVGTTGSDSNPGTAAQPFRTIQKAASVVNPGDTVSVAAGLYAENPIISRSGSSGSPITFTGVSQPVLFTSGDVFKVTGSFINISGFTFHSANNSAAATAYVPGSTFCYSTWTSGSSITFDNCIWENMGSPSAHWPDSDSADYCAIRLDGTNNTVKNSIIRNLRDMDAIGCAFGTLSTNCQVLKCECYNITNPNYASGPHSDWFQDGGGAQGFIIDGCYIHDCSAQIGVYSSDVTHRNCLFVNMINGAFFSDNGAKWFNNVFYNAGYQYGAPTIFAGFDVTCINNVFYYSTGGSFLSGSSSGTISHNYNGATPGFVNPTTPDFHISSPTSPLVGAGIVLPTNFADRDGVARPFSGVWDIGAYQYVPVPVPPITPIPPIPPAPPTTPPPPIRLSTDLRTTLVAQTGMPPNYHSRSREIIYDSFQNDPHFIKNPFGPQKLYLSRENHHW